MEFVLCNKRKIAVKLIKQQNFAVSKALFGKLWNHWSNILILNSENYCIPHRHRLLDQTTKQPLSNYEPDNVKNISNFEGWGLTRVAYKKSLVSYHFSFSVIHILLISNTLISNAILNLAKNQANAKQHPEVELLLLFTFSIHVIIQKK